MQEIIDLFRHVRHCIRILHAEHCIYIYFIVNTCGFFFSLQSILLLSHIKNEVTRYLNDGCISLRLQP